MASLENKGVRVSIHTMKALKNVLTACQLSVHLANEGSKSCSDQIEKGEKEKRAALKLYVQSAGQLSAHFIESN